MAIDDKRKLWIMTDNGTVTKFKKPGVVDFSVKAVDRPLKGPRIAIKEGMLFVLSDDRIEQVDILQAVMDASQPTEN